MDRPVMSTLLKIRCAVCGKLVDEWRILKRPENKSLVYQVRCHGDVDTCEIPDSAEVRNMTEGVAFTTKRIGS